LPARPPRATNTTKKELLANEEVFRQLKKVLAEGRLPPAGGEENTLTVEKGEDRRHYQFLI